MSKLTRDGAAERVSRDQILRRERGQTGKYSFSLTGSADHVQDGQSHPVDPYSDICMYVVVDSHIQHIVLATGETTVTQQVTIRPIKCQSRY